MDETVDGPDAAAIRRALAECMTLADVDDAMGWASGTARRRRWRDRDAGGLPPADAELGGVPLWFRATIARWRAATEAPAPSRPGDAGPIPPAEPVAEAEGPADGADGREVEDSEPAPSSAPAAGHGDLPTPHEVDTSGVPAAARPRSRRSRPSPDPPDAAAPDPPPTGFALATGQEVLAFVHGAWHPAVVVSRARATVVVDYQLGPGPLAARRQRVTLERIRPAP